MKPFTQTQAAWLLEAAQQKFADTREFVFRFPALVSWLFNQYPQWDTDEYRDFIITHLTPWYDTHPRVIQKQQHIAARASWHETASSPTPFIPTDAMRREAELLARGDPAGTCGTDDTGTSSG